MLVRHGAEILARPAVFLYVEADAVEWVEPTYFADVYSAPPGHRVEGQVVEEPGGFRIGSASNPLLRVVGWMDERTPEAVLLDLIKVEDLVASRGLDLAKERQAARAVF